MAKPDFEEWPDFEELSRIIAAGITSCWERSMRSDVCRSGVKVSCYWVGSVLRIDVKGLTKND